MLGQAQRIVFYCFIMHYKNMTFFAIFARYFFKLNIVAGHKPLTPAGPLCSKVLGKNYFIENELSNMIEKSNLRPKFLNSKPAVNRQPGFRRRDS